MWDGDGGFRSGPWALTALKDELQRSWGVDALRCIPGSFRANRYRHILRRRTFLIQSRNSQRVQQLSNGRCTLRHLLQLHGRRLVLGSCATLSLLLGWIISRNGE